MRETELAWAAGFFDGEGSIFLSRRKGYQRPTGKYQVPYALPCVSIHQCRTEPLERFTEAVGVGSVDGPYKPSGLGVKDVYQYSLQGRHRALLVAEALWPYLSTPKKEQFHEVWAELKEYLKGRRAHPLKDLPKL